MSMKKTPLVFAATLVMGLSACTDPERFENTDPNANTKAGALVGGIVGAVAGIALGDDPEERRRGAAIGAAVGAGTGGLIGRQLDQQAADLRRDIGNGDVKIVNTGSELIVTMPQDILFATDSAVVRSDLRRDIQALAGNLQAYPNTSVTIIGHTDNTGGASYNQQLSQRRADAVQSILLDSGISSSRILAVGRGENDPVATNLTAEGRSQNRRVEIIIRPIS
jgi:outer membrane protein OmpA-like peptidoglycan-associated protein